MSESNKALVTRFFEEVCNGRKLDVADQIFSSSHAYHDPQIPTGPGPLGMKQVISTYQKAYADARWTVEETFLAGENLVVTRWIGSGTQTGELNGIAPTQKKVKVSGIWIHEISGGKIVESWNNWDTLGMLQQLGVVPATLVGSGASAIGR
jgi:predicted SnoaL-like aldol condensation-catalyzing enzyme